MNPARRAAPTAPPAPSRVGLRAGHKTSRRRGTHQCSLAGIDSGPTLQTSRRRLSAALGGSLDTCKGGLALAWEECDGCGGDVAMGLKGAAPNNLARSLTGQSSPVRHATSRREDFFHHPGAVVRQPPDCPAAPGGFATREMTR